MEIADIRAASVEWLQAYLRIASKIERGIIIAELEKRGVAIA